MENCSVSEFLEGSKDSKWIIDRENCTIDEGDAQDVSEDEIQGDKPLPDLLQKLAGVMGL